MAQEAYTVIVDALIEANLTKAEALVGLMTVLATQYYGAIIPAERMQTFTKDFSEWMNMYFMDRAEGVKTHREPEQRRYNPR